MGAGHSRQGGQGLLVELDDVCNPPAFWKLENFGPRHSWNDILDLGPDRGRPALAELVILEQFAALELRGTVQAPELFLEYSIENPLHLGKWKSLLVQLLKGLRCSAAERGIPVFDGSAVLEVREVRDLRRRVSKDFLDALEGFALLADGRTWPDLHDMRHLFLAMQVHTTRAEHGVAGKP